MSERCAVELDLTGPAREELREFWTQYHLCTLTTLRADGTPHVVPVGATLDPDAGLVRVITSGGSRKAAHAGGPGAPVAICQVDGARWSTLEGHAVVSAEPARVAEAERRYAARYRTPRINPARVVLEVTITRILGNV